MGIAKAYRIENSSSSLYVQDYAEGSYIRLLPFPLTCFDTRSQEASSFCSPNSLSPIILKELELYPFGQSPKGQKSSHMFSKISSYRVLATSRVCSKVHAWSFWGSGCRPIPGWVESTAWSFPSLDRSNGIGSVNSSARKSSGGKKSAG